MNVQSRRSIVIPIALLVGVIVLLFNQRSIRIESFKDGAKCVIKGAKSANLDPADPQCQEYFKYQINVLSQTIENAPRTELGDDLVAITKREMVRWIQIRDNGAF